MTTQSLHATSLNAARRAADLAALADGDEVDLLVVGGGVTGAGVALDAASRGLSVALLEADDLAFGTSRWSSKLVHGGLRYLATGEVGLAHECAVERGILMTRTAPHLVHALPLLVPRFGGRGHPAMGGRTAAIVRAGLLAGDLLRRSAGTGGDVLPRPRAVSAAETMALVPGLRRPGLRGGLLHFDGQLTDDVALVVALARTAAGHGARVITRARVRRLSGRGAQATDVLSGREFSVRARAVVNATGVWAATLATDIALRPSRGSHLVLDAAATGLGGTALTVPVPDQPNRYLLLLPARDGRAYLGLTDEPLVGPLPQVPTVPEHDVRFLLSTASTVLDRQLSDDDVLGSFAGLRPLLAGSAGRSADLSRRHTVHTAADGLVTVVGGKLTSYRRMAAHAVDAALAAAAIPVGPSRTRDVALVGAAQPHALQRLDAAHRLVARYGTEAPLVAAMGELDPALGEPVAPGQPVTAAEVLWAVRHEGALDADDVLDRRTRIGLVPAQRTAAAATVADLVLRSLAGVGSTAGRSPHPPAE